MLSFDQQFTVSCQTGLKDESGSHTQASEKSDIERMLVVLQQCFLGARNQKP